MVSYVVERLVWKRTMPKTQNSPSGAVGIPSSNSAFWYSALLKLMLVVVFWLIQGVSRLVFSSES